MNTFNVPRIQTAELVAEATQNGSDIVLTFKGAADSQVVEEVDTMLHRVHQSALRLKTHEVVVDLRALEFMNSSCFKAFVTWVGDLQDLAHELQYRIRILSDDAKHWQRRSLGALSCFAVDLLSVET